MTPIERSLTDWIGAPAVSPRESTLTLMVLGPHRTIQGPMGKIIPPLCSAFQNAGFILHHGTWGRHDDAEGVLSKTVGRLVDVLAIRNSLGAAKIDVLFVPSSHDWRTVLRDLTLALFTRRRCRALILHIHGTSTWLSAPGRNLFRVATRALLSYYDAVIVSSTEERHVLEALGAPTPIVVADNIFVPEEPQSDGSRQRKLDIPTGVRIVTFASRLMAEKGILEFLDAAVELVKDRSDVFFAVAGTGPLEDEMRRRLDQSPLRERSKWFGYVDRKTLSQLLADSAVFVLPTYHNEGFPQVVQEALAVGAPVVTTAHRGTADHLSDGVSALLVEPKDSVGLRLAVTRILDNPELGRRLSAEAVAVVQRFHPERVIGQYIRALHLALAQAAPRTTNR